MDTRKLIFYLTGALVLALVLAAFVLSYGAVYDLALFYGWSTRLAWMTPLMLDFFVIVGKMDILRRSLDKARTIYPWALVVVFSGLAVLFNVLHATPDIWTPAALGKQLFAALPPVVVLLAFHLFVEQLKARIGAPAAARRKIEPIVSGDVPANVQKMNGKKRTAPLTPGARRAAIPGLVSEGMSPADLAGHFNVSGKTIQRDLAALNVNGHP